MDNRENLASHDSPNQDPTPLSSCSWHEVAGFKFTQCFFLAFCRISLS